MKQNELEEIIVNVADGVRVRSTCHWYKEGEKSNKFFLNLEKQSQGHIKKVIVDGKKNLKEKKNELDKCFESIYKKYFKNFDGICQFLGNIRITQIDSRYDAL